MKDINIPNFTWILHGLKYNGFWFCDFTGFLSIETCVSLYLYVFPELFLQLFSFCLFCYVTVYLVLFFLTYFIVIL